MPTYLFLSYDRNRNKHTDRDTHNQSLNVAINVILFDDPDTNRPEGNSLMCGSATVLKPFNMMELDNPIVESSQGLLPPVSHLYV